MQMTQAYYLKKKSQRKEENRFFSIIFKAHLAVVSKRKLSFQLYIKGKEKCIRASKLNLEIINNFDSP